MAILYGMFYPLSDVSAGKMKFSTDIDAVKKLFGSMYKSTHKCEAQFTEKERFSRTQELQKVFKFVADSDIDYKSLYNSDQTVLNRDLFFCPITGRKKMPCRKDYVKASGSYL